MANGKFCNVSRKKNTVSVLQTEKPKYVSIYQLSIYSFLPPFLCNNCKFIFNQIIHNEPKDKKEIYVNESKGKINKSTLQGLVACTRF